MAATSHPLATDVAINILKKSGTAVDAAIAANAILGLMEPTGAGIGGDLFAIIWEAKSSKLHGLNASGRSPKSLTLDKILSFGLEKMPSCGFLPITVPGAVDGWFSLHDKFGKLDFFELLEPSISYANNGFYLTRVIAEEWKIEAQRLGKYPGFQSIYAPNGNIPKSGELFKNPMLAKTYELIAQNGRDEFYGGMIADKIDRFMSDNGGYLRKEDLLSHSSDWVEPVSSNYKGYDIWELPPNSQGLAVLQMLNMLEDIDLNSLSWGSADHIHLLVEAKKIAFEDRSYYYSDPEFSNIPIAELISKDYAKERKKLINFHKASTMLSYGDPEELSKGDTVYLTVADSAGNMISLIQSNFRGMGSGIILEDLGFVFHNRGELFNLDTRHRNAYSPSKRPFHTIIPAFVTKDNQPYMSFGVMGADMQPQGQVQVLTNHLDFGMDIQAAGDMPRFRHEGSSSPTGATMTDGGRIFLEPGFEIADLDSLKSMGHKLALKERGGPLFGGYQAILLDQNKKMYYGASESRKDGFAKGY
jgi:gamma-glutamyltranspeptidase/glutathione hydrolase